MAKQLAVVFAALIAVACQPVGYRKQADKVAHQIIDAKQREALGRNEPFTIDTPADTLRRRLQIAQGLPFSGPQTVGSDALPQIEHWPEKDYPHRDHDLAARVVEVTEAPLKLSLLQAMQIAAANSREYQLNKEDVFLAALDLDLEADAYRNTFFGLVEGLLTADHTAGGKPVTTAVASASTGVTRRLRSGATLTGRIGLDIIKLLSPNTPTSRGLFADASVSIPLLRGSGQHIVTEPLTQAERDVVYALWEFERFKHEFAISIVDGYLSVLQAADQVDNAAKNYESQVVSARRSQALFDEDRLSKVQLDQARQAELQARERWIEARKRFADEMDRFKQSLGLPTDALVELDPGELQGLVVLYSNLESPSVSQANEEQVPPADAAVVLPPPTMEGAGQYEIDEQRAVLLALEHRLDLQVRKGRVLDAQRRVVVRADALRPDLLLTADATTSATDDVRLRPDRGFYSAGLVLDLPWERTAERNLYRTSFILLEAAVRSAQELEDQIKFQVREALRRLVQARESLAINRIAIELAEQRVDQARMSLDLGRAGVEIRDVLEAEADLLQARNRLSASLVSYRLAELQLQRDMGVLAVNEKGLVNEYDTTKQN